MIFLYLPDHEYIFLYYNVLVVNSKCVICYLYLLMITQELVRQVTKEQDNNRVYKADLSNKLITRISGLRPFSKLRCLILNFNHIRAMENLECLPDLRQLHLQNNQITSLCGLQNNKMLTLLNLTENSIEKIQNIGHLIKLQTLMIDNNRIEKVVGLQTLKDLKYLSISGNKLSSIDSLPAFSKLQVLNAEKNMIKKISPLTFAKSNKLLRLNLAQNLLDDVSFVNSLTSLEQLNISHNNISKLQFSILKNLEYLNISNNKIDQLPKIALIFPQLSTFLFANNQIRSQFQLIQSLAEAEMIVEVDFRGNTMATPEFADTLYKLYGYDRINQKNYNKPGTRYLSKAQQIQKIIHDEGMGDIENDEDVRKIMMSGFYNDDLEEQMTGVKPDRPSSGTRTRLGPSLNFQEMQKSYNQIIRNQKRYETLRKQCLQIFENNNIVVNVPRPKIEDQQSEQLQSSRGMMTQVKNLTENTNTISELQTRNEENANKWKELKNRQKNFNIRGLVRKMSNSQKKPGPLTKEGSLNKIPSPHERSQLMKTQLNPPRWNNDPSLMRTMQSRPFSAKKKDK